jgi:hypothetical protein
MMQAILGLLLYLLLMLTSVAIISLIMDLITRKIK